MTRIVFRRAAIADLDQIWRHVAPHDLAAADRLNARLRASVHRLETFPLSAPRAPELGEDIHKLSAHGHAISYRLRDEQLDILRVIDARRNVASVFGNRRR